MPNQLSKLTKRADAVAQSASVLVSRSIREIRGEIANLSRELNLAGNAEDREGVYNMIRKRMDRLSRDLHKLLVAQNQAAAKGAAKDASAMTGLEIRYSAQRAKAICELVTPAQGENLAAVFTDKMGENAINALREATVSAMRMQAVSGGSLKSLSRDMAARWFDALPDAPSFIDVSGRTWNTATYFQMNVRTNTMRVYNDCLVDDVAQAGEDLMRVSKGGDPDCSHCFAWEGAIISISGKTKGLPTYEDARNGGCFHPNCTHTLEYVVEALERDEIALQQQFPFDPDKADDPDAQDERRYEIDQARYRAKGLTKEQARVAVDRDNLEASIRSGLIRADAKDIVAKMTDAQVTALCPDGNPPAFLPVKKVKGGTRAEPKYEPERWNHGKRGGVVHIKRDSDINHILDVTGATERQITFDKAKAIERAGKSDGTTLVLSDIDKATAAEIKAACGVTPKTMTPTVGGNEIQHTFNRHGNTRTVNGRTYGEKSKKQVPITAKDIAMIPDIIKSHDSVEAGSYNKTERSESVKFVKVMPDGTTYTVFAVADTLAYKTMWKKK